MTTLSPLPRWFLFSDISCLHISCSSSAGTTSFHFPLPIYISFLFMLRLLDLHIADLLSSRLYISERFTYALHLLTCLFLFIFRTKTRKNSQKYSKTECSKCSVHRIKLPCLTIRETKSCLSTAHTKQTMDTPLFSSQRHMAFSFFFLPFFFVRTSSALFCNLPVEKCGVHIQALLSSGFDARQQRQSTRDLRVLDGGAYHPSALLSITPRQTRSFPVP